MPRSLVVGVLLVTIGLAGCFNFGGQNCEISPGELKCQVGGAGKLDIEKTFVNNATRAKATIEMGGSGNATVTVLDANNTEVMSTTIDSSGGAREERTSQEGVVGTWTVKINADYQGGLQVKVRSA